MNDKRTTTFHGTPGTTFDLVWFEHDSSWHIRSTDLTGALYSTEGWDTKHAAVLAFERGPIAYQAEVPGAGA